MIFTLKQYRLMPSLAVCLALKNYAFSIFMNLAEFYMGLMANDLSARQVIRIKYSLINQTNLIFHKKG